MELCIFFPVDSSRKLQDVLQEFCGSSSAYKFNQDGVSNQLCVEFDISQIIISKETIMLIVHLTLMDRKGRTF